MKSVLSRFASLALGLGAIATLGKLRAGLRALEIADNTVLWYCSDNGAIPQGSTGGLRGRKGSLYEGGLRVPGLLEWPAKIPQPRHTDIPCSTVDIFPTLLELAGAPAPPQRPLDGISLVPLLEGRMKTRPRPLGFWDYEIRGLAVKSSQLLEVLAEEQAAGDVRPAAEVDPIPAAQTRGDYAGDRFPKHAAWIQGDWKLHRIEGAERPVRWELYNLASDRTETHNVFAEESRRAATLQRELEAWLRSVVHSLNGGDYPGAPVPAARDKVRGLR